MSAPVTCQWCPACTTHAPTSPPEYTVTVEYDPTGPALMRWSANIRKVGGDRWSGKDIYCATTRKSAERQARRWIRRSRNERRSYTLKVTR